MRRRARRHCTEYHMEGNDKDLIFDIYALAAVFSAVRTHPGARSSEVSPPAGSHASAKLFPDRGTCQRSGGGGPPERHQLTCLLR
jgi:hypothetical protein